MKRLILLCLVLSNVACGNLHHTVPTAHAEGSPLCEHQVSAEDIEYPDHVVRKSEIQRCTYQSGATCLYATWVNDPSVTFTTCL